MSKAQRDGHEFTAECDVIDMGEECVKDESWRYVDGNGHVHTWTSGTWETKSGEEYEYSQTVCTICGRPIPQPGMRYTGFRAYRAGQAHYYIDGVEVGRDEFNRRGGFGEYANGL